MFIVILLMSVFWFFIGTVYATKHQMSEKITCRVFDSIEYHIFENDFKCKCGLKYNRKLPSIDGSDTPIVTVGDLTQQSLDKGDTDE